MEWRTLRHLDVRGHSQAAAFHPSLPLLALASERLIKEFDAVSGCQLASVDIGGHVVRMGYSPAAGHVIVAVLNDMTIRTWDLESEHTAIIYSPPDRRSDRAAELHIALTPFKPWLFFAIHRRTSVYVVNIMEGSRGANKIKLDVKKPITCLACHPRLPLLLVAYADGLIKTINIKTSSVAFNLQVEDPSLKLSGAASISFHHSLDHVFVGDRVGALMAWDVSVANRPNLIGFLQVSNSPIFAVTWHATLHALLVLTWDGQLLTFHARIIQNPALSLAAGAQFFEPAIIESLDIQKILSQAGGSAPPFTPRLRYFVLHPRFNLLVFLFLRGSASEEEAQKRVANRSRESRRQLMEALQAARSMTETASQKERLSSSLGTNVVMSDQLLQQHLILTRGQSKIVQTSLVDYARKTFLYGASSLPSSASPSSLSSLPLLRLEDPVDPTHDIPVCHPFHCDLSFFNSEQAIFTYPARLILMDATNIVSYALPTGAASLLKKLPALDAYGIQRVATHMVYSQKQQTFLIFFSSRSKNGVASSVVVQRFLDVMEPLGEGIDSMTELTGSDGAFTGKFDSIFALLDDEGYVLTLHPLPNANEPEEEEEEEKEEEPAAAAESSSKELDETTFTGYGFGSRFDEVAEASGGGADGKAARIVAPVQFMLETSVHRIFATPLENTLLYVCAGSHMGLMRAFVDESGRPRGDLVEADGMLLLSTRQEEGRALKLKPLEMVLQVWWQGKHDGPVAAVLTTHRLLIVSSSLRILAATAATADQGYPPFKSCVWVGPALLFTTDTSLSMLGWDSVVRPLLSLQTPSSVIMGAVNDRVFIANCCLPSAARPAAVEVRSRLVGLLEPLLLGWVSLVQAHGQDASIRLKSLAQQLVARFDCQRVTPRLVDVLSQGPAVCCQLAVEIAESGPQFSSEVRCLCAIRARQFERALKSLMDDFMRSPDYPRCPPTSRLFQRFRDLGRCCITYAQFDMAKQAFEAVGDFESMFDLFLCHMNPSALRQLTQKLEESGSSAELQRQCEAVLKVRSSLWGQGGVLSAITSDGMAPKGQEWAGGNWTLKTAEQSEAKEKWELSSEISAYMKSAGGAIPTISGDSIGVYLGVASGKGTVVEVLEFKKEGSGAKVKKGAKKKATEEDIMAAAAASFINISGTGGKESGRESGKESVGTASDDGRDAEDAQKRAEAEFNRGLFGNTSFDSDSDEDDAASVMSRRSKFSIKIREKDSSSAIDINKLRAASRTLKLGDPSHSARLPPPSDPSFSSEIPPATQPWQQFTAVELVQMQQLTPPHASLSSFEPPLSPLHAPSPTHPIWASKPDASLPPKPPSAAVPLQAVALGWAKPQLPPPQQQQLQQQQDNSSGKAAADPFGDEAPFQAQDSSQLTLPPPPPPSSAFSINGLPGVPPSLSSQQLQGAFLPPPLALRSALQGPSVPGPPSQPSAPQEFGGLLSGTAEGAGKPLAPISAAAVASASQSSAVDAGLPAELKSLAGSSDMANGEAAAKQNGGAVQSTEAEPLKVEAGFVPRGAPATVCFKVALIHVENTRLRDAALSLDEAFLSLAKDASLAKDVKPQAKLCAQYKMAVMLLQEINRLQKSEQMGAVGAKDEMARLSRHLASLPLQQKHRISCMRTSIKRNMEVQNYAYSKKLLDVLLSKAPPNRQGELRALVNVCTQRGLSDRTIEKGEDASKFCASTLGFLPTIGHDTCNVCSAKFSALASPGCPVCGMGQVHRSDASSSFVSPF